LPFLQFALLNSLTCVQVRLITILGNRGCVAVASFFGVPSPLEKSLDELESIQMEDKVKNALVKWINSGDAKANVRHLRKTVQLHM
jgi:hypothetical protein